MSFGSGDLFINSANINNDVANVTLFKYASLDSFIVQSMSCSKDASNTNAAIKTSIVKSITGENETPVLPIICKSGSDTIKWTFSNCSAYLPTIKATSVNSNKALAIAPCASECGISSTTASDGITVLVADFVQKVPAPSIQNIAFSSSKSQIVADVILSAPGSVYCSVFPLSYAPSSVDLVVMGGNVATTSAANSARVTISNLQASSTFSLYCVTYSVGGVKMAYDAMLSTKKVVSTSCCKSLIAHLLLTSFIQGSSEQNALRLSIDSPPSVDITIYLNMTRVSTSTTTVSSFFPKVVVFKAGVARSTVVSFQATTVGRYVLNFELAGTTASSEVKITYPSGFILDVIEAGKEVRPPQFLSATFSQTGASITVKFTAPTNKAGLSPSFACNSLLRFIGTHFCYMHTNLFFQSTIRQLILYLFQATQRRNALGWTQLHS